LIAAGATEQSRNRGPTVDRTRWFDQRVSAERKWVLATNRFSKEVLPLTAVFLDLIEGMV
jgi:hypothetical protein